MCKLTYSQLLKMRGNALWVVEVSLANGLEMECLRYYKILNRIERAMFNYSPVNELKTV